MKDIPRHLTIGKQVYCVVLTTDVDERYAGSCDMGRKAILISANEPADQILPSLLHEVLHAIEKEYAVKLGHKRINKLEYALAQVFEQLK